jgi:hypothetical protein
MISLEPPLTFPCRASQNSIAGITKILHTEIGTFQVVFGSVELGNDNLQLDILPSCRSLLMSLNRPSVMSSGGGKIKSGAFSSHIGPTSVPHGTGCRRDGP